MIKVKVFGASRVWKEAVCNTDGYVGISLHSPNMCGARLHAIVSWINENTSFSTLRIGLSDTLNRHNYMVQNNWDEAKAYEEAIEQGNLWLEENGHILDKLGIPYRIFRWDNWMAMFHDEVQEYTQAFRQSFEDKNSELRAAIRTDVINFYGRYLKKTPSAVTQFSFQKSVDYLIEELAVYSKIFEKYPSTKIYPGKELGCFKALRDGDFADVPNYIQNSKFVGLRLWGTEEAKILQVANEVQGVGEEVFATHKR